MLDCNFQAQLRDVELGFHAQFHDFPGAKAGFTTKLKHVPEVPEEPVPCFRILDEHGRRMQDSHIPEVVDAAMGHVNWKILLIAFSVTVWIN